jgi:hypothetical protein
MHFCEREIIQVKQLRSIILLIMLGSVLVACVVSSVGTPLATSTPDKVQPKVTIQPTAAISELVEIDDIWNQYTNYRLGFSMRVPRMQYRHDADCYWNETESDSSYRPLGAIVPVVVIEGEDRVFITGEYYSELTLPTQIPSGNGYRTEFDGCEQVTNDLDRMLATESTSFFWEIVVWDIAFPADLEALVDAVYGECFSVGEISPVEGRGYQQVRVQGDGKPVEESTCLLRGGYIFYYSPELGRAATWLTGQSYHFPADAEYAKAYDAQMVENFEFIED